MAVTLSLFVLREDFQCRSFAERKTTIAAPDRENDCHWASAPEVVSGLAPTNRDAIDFGVYGSACRNPGVADGGENTQIGGVLPKSAAIFEISQAIRFEIRD